jgi:hypothetical protein
MQEENDQKQPIIFFWTMTDNKLPLLASFAAGMATVAMFNKFVAQKKIDRTNGKWPTRE